MSYQLISSILKGVWAINPEVALSHGMLISSILTTSRLIEKSPEPECNLPFAVDAVNSGMKYGRDYDKVKKSSVAVVPIVGELLKYDMLCGPAGMVSLAERIKEADAHDNISAIVLRIDSPGGTVDGTRMLGETVKNTKKPVVAFVDGMMCSAALWIGSQADEIIASSPMDQVGSIGVMISFADMQPYWEKKGVKFHYVTADQSSEKNKVFLDLKEGKYEGIKGDVLNPLAEEFIELVKTSLPGVKEEHLKGKVFFAKDVVGELVHKIGSFASAIERAYQISQPNTEVYV